MLIMLFINTLEIKYLICPIVLLVLDLAFIVKVLFSNYRFKYAVIGVIIHVACIVVTCVGAILITEVLDDRIVFETFALIAMPGVHLLQCIAALCNAWQAAYRGKLVRRIVAIAMSALLLAGVGVYANFLRTNGFFGQGVAKIDRTVVYALDESGSHYIVTDVLDGKGNTVTVPAEFNGLPVKGIDCSLFANEELSYVVFNCGTELEFLNPGALSHVNEHLSLTADKSTIDQFRNTHTIFICEICFGIKCITFIHDVPKDGMSHQYGVEHSELVPFKVVLTKNREAFARTKGYTTLCGL
jgi:hypothetical protein